MRVILPILSGPPKLEIATRGTSNKLQGCTRNLESITFHILKTKLKLQQWNHNFLPPLQKNDHNGENSRFSKPYEAYLYMKSMEEWIKPNSLDQILVKTNFTIFRMKSQKSGFLCKNYKFGSKLLRYLSILYEFLETIYGICSWLCFPKTHLVVWNDLFSFSCKSRPKLVVWDFYYFFCITIPPELEVHTCELGEFWIMSSHIDVVHDKSHVPIFF